MYYYLSFLRPPPTTIDLASPFASNAITITPQIANDLRTELLDDRSTEIWYSWSQTPSSRSPESKSTNHDKINPHTLAAKLTTYEPPSSTYKPINVPLPPKCRAGETWVLSLFSPPGGSAGEDMTAEGMIPLRKGEILGVQSMGIDFYSSSSSPSSSARPGPSSKPQTSKRNGKSGSGVVGSEKQLNGKKSTGAKQVEGPKQTRITRSWVLPRVSLPEAASSSPIGSSGVNSALNVSQEDRKEDEGIIGGRTSLKRDSEGVPVVRQPVRRDGSDSQTNLDNPEPEEDVADESGLTPDKGEEARGERRLRVIEETSFDLDKKIWDSGLALTSYLLTLSASNLDTPQTDLRPVFLPPADLMDRLSKPNSRILEIGAGSGLVGIGWAASGIALGRGSRVMITDLPSAIPLIDENIELNRGLWKASSGVTVLSGVLDWDEEVPDWVWTLAGKGGEEEEAGLDLILAADVTYNTASFPALVSTLKRLFTPPSPTSNPPLLLLAYKQRHASERTLWPALKAVGIELERFGSIPGHEVDLEVDVVTGRDEEQGEEARSGMGATELWVGRRRA